MDDNDDSAMEEMMGFSAFGSNKRKKLNSGAVSSLPPKPPTTASNSTPIGKRITKPKSPLSMIPASLPPSGRTSASPPPTTNWNAAKLPNPIKYGETKSEDQRDQYQEQNQDANSDAKPAVTSSTSTNSPRASLNASAETFLPSRSAPSQLSTAQAPPMTTNAPTNSTTIYSANDIRSEPSYWKSPASKRPATSASTRNFSSRHANVNFNENDDEIAYTSPYTGTTLTRKDIREYGSGKQEVQSDGSTVTVFFKPGFLASADELWGRWLPREESTEEKVEGLGKGDVDIAVGS